jgi:CubicO group peptidase (beta-lactamase class C family)
LADAGTRWAYHNAPYTLLEGVLENATGLPINTYTQLKLKNATGMNGNWLTVDFNNVFFSTARSMARFGLLIQGNGNWDGNQLINSSYFNEMVNTSQTLNKSYGYLWWLNGKPSYMLPTTQFVFQGSYAPDAPTDMISGLGRDGQIVSISQSRGLVFVRMGEAPTSGSSDITTVFCNQIWQKVNELVCNLAVTTPEKENFLVSPNPATTSISITPSQYGEFTLDIFDMLGNSILKVNNKTIIDISDLSTGMYIINFQQGNTSMTQKLIKK